MTFPVFGFWYHLSSLYSCNTAFDAFPFYLDNPVLTLEWTAVTVPPNQAAWVSASAGGVWSLQAGGSLSVCVLPDSYGKEDPTLPVASSSWDCDLVCG